jgi:rubrerythrin
MSTNFPKLTTPLEILEAALEKEEDAYNFYGVLLERTKIEMLQDVLETLRNEEYKHMEIIKKMIADIKFG